MQHAFPFFLCCVAASVALAVLAVSQLPDPSSRWRVLLVPLPICFIFNGPGPCDQYRFLIDPLGGHLGALGPLLQAGLALTLAVGSAWLVSRWTTPSRYRLALIALTFGAYYALLSPDPTGVRGPVGAVGWWLTIVVSYLSARALCATLFPVSRYRLLVEALLAMAVTFSMMLVVETMGASAELWEWREPGTEARNMDHALGGGECPAFVPFAQTGFFPFPVGSAFVGWVLQITFVPTALLFLVTESRPGLGAKVLVAGLVLFSPVALLLTSWGAIRSLRSSGVLVLSESARMSLGDVFPKLHVLAVLIAAFGVCYVSRSWLVDDLDGPRLTERLGSRTVPLLCASIAMVLLCCAGVFVTLGEAELIVSGLPLFIVCVLLLWSSTRIAKDVSPSA